jgi:hypothetical protein
MQDRHAESLRVGVLAGACGQVQLALPAARHNTLCGPVQEESLGHLQERLQNQRALTVPQRVRSLRAQHLPHWLRRGAQGQLRCFVRRAPRARLPALRGCCGVGQLCRGLQVSRWTVSLESFSNSSPPIHLFPGLTCEPPVQRIASARLPSLALPSAMSRPAPFAPATAWPKRSRIARSAFA